MFEYFIKRLALELTGCDPKRYLKQRSTMTTLSPSATPMTASPAAAVAPVKPKVGGIHQNSPFTGGPRDPQLAVPYPPCPYMERDRSTNMKVFKACKAGIQAEFSTNRSLPQGLKATTSENNHSGAGLLNLELLIRCQCIRSRITA